MIFKRFSAILIILAFLAGLSFPFSVQRVEAIGSIHVRADGSVDPPTSPISTLDNFTYIFTDHITDSIVVERDNVIVEGAGYSVHGAGSGNGIEVSHRNNVTLRNITITNFEHGIYVASSHSNILLGNNASNNNHGIRLKSSWNNTLTGNTAVHNKMYGFYLCCSSSNNTLTGNTAAHNKIYGISIGSSYNNTITGNTFFDNLVQAYVTPGIVNIWNRDFPTGGNYWSDYKEKYPNTTELNGSNIWNMPYIINEYNQDNYPLIPELPSFLLLPLFMMTTLLLILTQKRKQLTRS